MVVHLQSTKSVILNWSFYIVLVGLLLRCKNFFIFLSFSHSLYSSFFSLYISRDFLYWKKKISRSNISVRYNFITILWPILLATSCPSRYTPHVVWSKLRQFAVSNWIVINDSNSDFKLGWQFRYKSDSKLTIETKIAISIKIWSLFY